MHSHVSHVRSLSGTLAVSSAAAVLLLAACALAAPRYDVGTGTLIAEPRQLVLPSDERQLKTLFPEGAIEVYNDDTALLFAPDIVYQIDIPQVARAAKIDFARVDVTADFDAFDRNRDGAVSLDEFVEVSGAAANAAAVYETLDADNNRSVSRVELERAPWIRRTAP